MEISTDRIEIGEEPWEIEALNDLVARISSMWAPWADHISQPRRMLDQVMTTLAPRAAPSRAPQPPADPDETAARVSQLWALTSYDDLLPDWGGSDEDEVPVVTLPVPAQLPHTPAPIRRGWLRIGVDLGGVLLPKFPVNRLGKLRTPADLASLGYAPGVQEWFAECAAHCGPENIYVISYVSSQRLRALFSAFLCGPGGLLTVSGVPRENLTWTDTRAAKVQPFVPLFLTHFIDDQVEVLTAIRAACWEERRAPPTLFLVPTQWADGKSTDFGRVCADAASAGWQLPWCLFPARSAPDVRPW